MTLAPLPVAYRVGRLVCWLIVALMGASALFALVVGYLNWVEIGV